MARVPVLFGKGSWKLRFDKGTWIIPLLGQQGDIDDSAAMLMQDQTLIAVVVGHASLDEGSAQESQQLSENRAAAVKNRLLGKGVDPSQLLASGAGTSQPEVAEDGKTPEGRELQRRQNRFVDVFVNANLLQPAPRPSPPPDGSRLPAPPPLPQPDVPPRRFFDKDPPDPRVPLWKDWQEQFDRMTRKRFKLGDWTFGVDPNTTVNPPDESDIEKDRRQRQQPPSPPGGDD